MLLYISSNDNINIFDFLSDEKGMVIKKLSGSFNLKQFVINDMRSFNHYRYLAIDLKALKDIDDEIIEAIIAFKSMYSSRVVFHVDDVQSHENLIIRLVEAGIYNIVYSENVEGLNEEILQSISGLGISKRMIQARFNQTFNYSNEVVNEYSFNKTNVKIAITGAFNRVGTTTVAINICSYLASIGARVCYIEANNSNHIKELPKEYSSMDIIDGYIVYKGVRFLPLNYECDEEFDFIIYDMGVLDLKIKNAMKYKCDVSVLCSTTKAYEMSELDEATSLLDEHMYNIVLSFVPEYKQNELKEKYDNALFTKYTPNPFDGEVNRDIWEELLSRYITKEVN